MTRHPAIRAAIVVTVAVALVVTFRLWHERPETKEARQSAEPVAADGLASRTVPERRPASADEASAGERSVHAETEPGLPGDDGYEAARQPVPAEQGTAPQILAGDLPHYLDAIMRPIHAQRDPRGCKTAPLALVDMAEETRDELWAARVERELANLLGNHPLGFEVTVSCRATICQATEYGELEELRDSGNAREAKAYWDSFRDALLAGPMNEEIARWHGFAGSFVPEPDKHIAGYVLVGAGRATLDEPAYCDDFDGV